MIQVQQALLAQQVLLVQRVRRVLLVQQVIQVQQVLLVQLAQLVLLVQRVQQVQLAQRVRRVLLVQQVIQVQQVQLAQRVIQAQRVRLAQQAPHFSLNGDPLFVQPIKVQLALPRLSSLQRKREEPSIYQEELQVVRLLFLLQAYIDFYFQHNVTVVLLHTI